MTKEKVTGISSIIIGLVEIFVMYSSRTNVFDKILQISEEVDTAINTNAINALFAIVLILGMTNIVNGIILLLGKVKSSKVVGVIVGVAVISILVTVASFWFTYFSAIFSVYNVTNSL